VARQTQLATILAARYAGGRDAVWREGDAGGGGEGLPVEHHLPPRAQLHAAGQGVQPLRSNVPHLPVGHQNRRPRVPRCDVWHVNDIHPHGQLLRARAPRVERRLGARGQVIPHVQARRRRARRAVLLPDDA